MNNTHITCVLEKQVIFKKSCGMLFGIKGAKRSSIFAAQELAYQIGKYFKNYNCDLYISGFGKGRWGCMKGLFLSKVKINNIYHVQRKSFNGCRKKKKRRLL